MTRFEPYVVEPAEQQDLNAVTALLKTVGLPIEGVAEHLPTFLVARYRQSILGVMGLEVYGDTALLRSAAVAPDRQKSGIGSVLFKRIIALARESGVRRLILLTDTAQEYFGRQGFTRIDAKTVSGPITRSVEFTGACPSTAVCMEMSL